MFSNPFIAVINSLLPEPHASLLNGILFGIRTTMPKDLYHALLDTGTLHIIALSGMNISILINLTARITLFLGRKTSSILSICLIVIFVLFVGASPTIVRAAIMGSMSLMAVYFGRQSWSLLSLFLASGIMLLYKIDLISNISFQLSFLATLGIISANKKNISSQKNNAADKAIYALKENLRLTINAQLFTLPVIIYNFHRISLIAPLANILIEWVIQPIMILGLVISVIGWIWLPLAVIPSWIAWLFLTYLITVIKVLSIVPLSSVKF